MTRGPAREAGKDATARRESKTGSARGAAVRALALAGLVAWQCISSIDAQAAPALLDGAGRPIAARPADAGTPVILAGVFRNGRETDDSVLLRLDGERAFISVTSFAE